MRLESINSGSLGVSVTFLHVRQCGFSAFDEVAMVINVMFLERIPDGQTVGTSESGFAEQVVERFVKVAAHAEAPRALNTERTRTETSVKPHATFLYYNESY
jgi:hypothetical protein